MKPLIILAALLLLGTAPLSAQSQPPGNPDIREIVHRANRMAYYQADDGRAKVTMTITDKQGRKRERKLTILRRDTPRSDDLKGDAYYGEQKFYVFFHRPADVSKVVFLVWKALEGQDSRWLYLPGLDLVKRIAASDKRTSFVGSDFTYEDVSGRAIGADTHTLVKSGKTFFELKSTPMKPDEVEFGHFVSFIHKKTFLPVQVTYYDKNGKKLREYKALKVKKVQGRTTVARSSMTNFQTGSSTVMDYTSVDYDVGLPNNIFTERYLRKAPRKFLR